MCRNSYEMLIQSLTQELGVDTISFEDDFTNLGWKISTEDNSDEWELMFKYELEPLPPKSELPELRNHCWCGHFIVWNHLVRYNPTGKLFVVGNVCINNAGTEMKRVCISCKKRNSKHTDRCGDCRIRCGLHNTFHNDNRYCGEKAHRICPTCNNRNRARTLHCAECRIKCRTHHAYHDDNTDCKAIELKERAKAARLEQIIDFGKFKGTSYKDALARDKGYFRWLVREQIRGHESWLGEYL